MPKIGNPWIFQTNYELKKIIEHWVLQVCFVSFYLIILNVCMYISVYKTCENNFLSDITSLILTLAMTRRTRMSLESKCWTHIFYYVTSKDINEKQNQPWYRLSAFALSLHHRDILLLIQILENSARKDDHSLQIF